jgi:RNA polymerase sigma-70 factor (ECF subfamily)
VETNDLVRRAHGGDTSARDCLFDRHRERLRKMVAVRMDQRLRGRLDPSDVVQEVLTEAWKRIEDYLGKRPLPFYPWLRQLAWERLVKLHQRHLHAGKRAIQREQAPNIGVSDEAMTAWLPSPGSSPSSRAVRAELESRIHDALARLPEKDRDVLVMRYLEGLSTAETAEILGTSVGAVKVRHFRALERLRNLLGESNPEVGT